MITSSMIAAYQTLSLFLCIFIMFKIEPVIAKMTKDTCNYVRFSMWLILVAALTLAVEILEGYTISFGSFLALGGICFFLRSNRRGVIQRVQRYL